VEATSAPRPHALRIPRPRKYLSALSDERLVEHVRRGEAAAFEVLYDRHSTGILGFCRHMLGNSADAEDAVQHTFIAAHADIQRHDNRDLHVKAWLYTIARNRCLSMLRARREQATGDGVELATDNLLHDVQHRDDIRALLGDIAKLPEEQREALVLAEVGDLSHSDISDILGCEVSKVKSLVFQARTALIDRRTARETPCAEIREQLATLRGGALRRSHLRHHLDACPGCTAYRDQIRRQRAMLAVALPVLPSAALKANVLSSVGLGTTTAAAATAGAGGAAATATTGGMGVAATGGVAAKLGLVAVLAVGAAGGATVANSGNLPLVHDSSPAPTKVDKSHNATAATSAAHTSTTGESAAALTAAEQKKLEHETNGSRRSASGTEHGFTPVTGESNGARARAFAQTRGKGKDTSAAHRHVTAHKRSRPAKRVRVKHVAAPPPAPTRTAPTRTQPTSAPKTTTTQPTATQPTTTTPTSTTTTPTYTTESTAPSGGGKGKSGTAVGNALQAG
jgi:RNA polymerase sigma factor (sigma-70 family)